MYPAFLSLAHYFFHSFGTADLLGFGFGISRMKSQRRTPPAPKGEGRAAEVPGGSCPLLTTIGGAFQGSFYNVGFWGVGICLLDLVAKSLFRCKLERAIRFTHPKPYHYLCVQLL